MGKRVREENPRKSIEKYISLLCNSFPLHGNNRIREEYGALLADNFRRQEEKPAHIAYISLRLRYSLQYNSERENSAGNQLREEQPSLDKDPRWRAYLENSTRFLKRAASAMKRRKRQDD